MDAEKSPSRVLRQIQQLFQQWKIFKRKLPLEHEGLHYLIICDEQAFMVYRVINSEGLPHGLPGWPVCLVTPDSIVDESSPPLLAEDHLACPWGISDWLKIIQEQFSPAG